MNRWSGTDSRTFSASHSPHTFRFPIYSFCFVPDLQYYHKAGHHRLQRRSGINPTPPTVRVWDYNKTTKGKYSGEINLEIKLGCRRQLICTSSPPTMLAKGVAAVLGSGLASGQLCSGA